MNRRTLLARMLGAVAALVAGPELARFRPPAPALPPPPAALAPGGDTPFQVRRFSMPIELSDELLADAQFDLLESYTRAAGRALRARQEELIFGVRA